MSIPVRNPLSLILRGPIVHNRSHRPSSASTRARLVANPPLPHRDFTGQLCPPPTTTSPASFDAPRTSTSPARSIRPAPPPHRPASAPHVPPSNLVVEHHGCPLVLSTDATPDQPLAKGQGISRSSIPSSYAICASPGSPIVWVYSRIHRPAIEEALDCRNSAIFGAPHLQIKVTLNND